MPSPRHRDAAPVESALDVHGGLASASRTRRCPEVKDGLAVQTPEREFTWDGVREKRPDLDTTAVGG